MTSDLVPELTSEDELALRIGRVARAHVHLDNAVRQVYLSLVTPSPGMFLVNNTTSTSSLIEDCRLMIPMAQLTDDVKAAALVTLDAAKIANVTRNRVVHDMWIRPPGLSEDVAPQWMGLKNKRGRLTAEGTDPPRDLAFLDDALVELQRAHARLYALNSALWALLPSFPGIHRGDLDFERQLKEFIQVMHDRFDLPEGGWGYWPHRD